jgi:uncharacterized protein (DUF1810 family)
LVPVLDSPPMPASALGRFKSAQDSPAAGFASALSELAAGRKEGHWIWYVFPQVRGLGQSQMSHDFAISDGKEATAYASDPELLARLLEISAVVAARLREGVALTTLMGGRTDALKLVSSMTLFEWVAAKLYMAGSLAHRALATVANEILSEAEAQGYPRCQHTLRVTSEFDRNRGRIGGRSTE